MHGQEEREGVAEGIVGQTYKGLDAGDLEKDLVVLLQVLQFVAPWGVELLVESS